jgi:putative tryptophan/tyrosine transport system substrate-binding protein
LRLNTVVLVVTLALTILMAPLIADTQQARKVPRIGYLGDTPGPLLAAFHRALREHGYVEGQNIAFEYRWVEGQHDRLGAFAAELVHSQVDVIITAGTQASRAAKHATSTCPGIMAHVGNPVETGLVASLAQPGANLTGVSLVAAELAGKQLELLKEAVPRATRVAVFWNSANPSHGRDLQALQRAASELGMQLYAIDFQPIQDFERAFSAIITASVDGLVVIQDPHFFAHLPQIVALVAQSHLPSIYLYREWVEAGALMSYGPSIREVYRRVVALMDKILKGAKPADLPVEQVMRFELVLNLKTAQALGVKLPPHLLVLADEVVK